MNEEIIGWLLFVGFGCTVYVAFSLLGYIVKRINTFRARFANNKRLNKYKENLCKDGHDWLSLEDTACADVGSVVCDKCGFIPSGEGPMLFMQEWTRANIRLVKQNKVLLDEHKLLAKIKLAKNYNLDIGTVETIYEAGVNVLKEFHLSRMKGENERK
jgi:hypothetical protein